MRRIVIVFSFASLVSGCLALGDPVDESSGGKAGDSSIGSAGWGAAKGELDAALALDQYSGKADAMALGGAAGTAADAGVDAYPGSDSCTPKSCSQIGAECGMAPDGCGDTVDCGGCPTGEICGGSGAYKCGSTPCVPGSCPSNACGFYPDGCGNTISCGGCPTGQSCTGGVCSCTKQTCSANQCGTLSDGCGGILGCGACPTGQTCTSNTCTCTKKTCVTGQCGAMSDGCGGTLSCPSCPTGQTCSSNTCSCTPFTGATAWRSPASVSDDSSTGAIAWSNPSAAKVSDNVRSTVSISNSSYSHYLRATGFGFAIPAGATITGIEARIERSRSGTVNDANLRLIKGASLSGSKSDNWTTTESYVTLGGDGHDWSQSWVPGDINSSGFGLAMSVYCFSLGACSGTASVDHIQIRVFYSATC